MTALSGVESFRRNPPGPPCKPTDSRYSRSAVCIKPLCAICVSYSEEKRHSSTNKCSSQITNTSSVMCCCVSIHFALTDLSLCHGTDGSVDDLKIGTSKKLLFSQSHKTPYSRTKDIFVWSHCHTVVVLVSNREWSTCRFSFYALHSLPEFWVVSSSSQNSGGSCT
jgi:hypothetical protein